MPTVSLQVYSTVNFIFTKKNIYLSPVSDGGKFPIRVRKSITSEEAWQKRNFHGAFGPRDDRETGPDLFNRNLISSPKRCNLSEKDKYPDRETYGHPCAKFQTTDSKALDISRIFIPKYSLHRMSSAYLRLKREERDIPPCNISTGVFYGDIPRGKGSLKSLSRSPAHFIGKFTPDWKTVKRIGMGPMGMPPPPY